MMVENVKLMGITFDDAIHTERHKNATSHDLSEAEWFVDQQSRSELFSPLSSSSYPYSELGRL